MNLFFTNHKKIELILFNQDLGSNYNDNTFNEYHFQKQMNLHNTINDLKDHDLEEKKSVSNTFFPPLH